jgi:hypothetical protein
MSNGKEKLMNKPWVKCHFSFNKHSKPFMTQAELEAAIKRAREVRAFVPVGDFHLEVVVAKTKALKALRSTVEEWTGEGVPFEDRFEAEWLDDGVLLVGGDSWEPEVDFDKVEEAMKAWVQRYGRLDIPLSTKVGEDTLPESLTDVIGPMLEPMEEQFQKVLTNGDLSKAKDLVLKLAVMGDSILGVPHLLHMLHRPDQAKDLAEGFTDKDIQILNKICVATY